MKAINEATAADLASMKMEDISRQVTEEERMKWGKALRECLKELKMATPVGVQLAFVTMLLAMGFRFKIPALIAGAIGVIGLNLVVAKAEWQRLLECVAKKMNTDATEIISELNKQMTQPAVTPMAPTQESLRHIRVYESFKKTK